MNKMILSLTALAAFTSAPAAFAQAQYGYAGGGFDGRIDQLGDRIERGIQRGVFDRREAYRLRTEHVRLDRLEDRYSYNGLSRWERDDLQNRVQMLRERIRQAARYRGGSDWYGNDDRWDRDDWDDRYDN